MVECGSPRVRNRYGEDLYSHILWMRLDGLTIAEMAEKIGCSDEIIADCIKMWQTQIELSEGGPEQWTPRCRNPRRWANKPTPKIPA